MKTIIQNIRKATANKTGRPAQIGKHGVYYARGREA